ncbi:acyl-CoA dehydrogenase family protein [Jannaschia aquimarina]|uniref:BbsG protein n=1 Tax=Jannaschia aquimarina TaxID=935700 RepID=A0A0D1EMI8_9RHOB|nr:acyl-CoA dehydrogenase family protein [Jannaschia aquimarina]KIT16910.1 (R)-benzylsuccinyl-CoA dehydrogenase [Jannaschia aquimarina]SNT11799.1 Acyl-CoA dehydrogenase [Jannaschia aquimarina]
MDLGLSARGAELHEAVARMVREEIAPQDAAFHAAVGETGDRWKMSHRQTEILEGLKTRARERGLWNLWQTHLPGGPGISTVDYAWLAEEMGRSWLAPEVFNCNAPDTGNMEVFTRYGTDEMKDRWLGPLMEGRIRSAYLMTEPQVASSDATNISMRCERDGDGWILNGEKWWSTGAGDPRCAVHIVMCLTDPDGPRHGRHSMVVVPAETPGVEILRPLQVFGEDDAPHGHMHIRYTDVRVPGEAMLLGPGRGFEIAQGRLGPGRIHHCMRAIGMAEKALELAVARGRARQAFGSDLLSLGGNAERVAEARIAIDGARLVTLRAAWEMDAAERETGTMKRAAPAISAAKVLVPRVALEVCDMAIQLHGGAGVSQDTELARLWGHLRTLRLVDGPDAVHLRTVFRAQVPRG